MSRPTSTKGPWIEVVVPQSGSNGTIGVEYQRGSSHGWLVFYGPQGGRHHTRSIDATQATKLALYLRALVKSIERSA